MAAHAAVGTDMNIEVITSFDQRYYDLIGKKSVDTWLEYWPQDLQLTCYVEDMRVAHHDRMRQIDFDALGADYQAFQSAPVKGRVHTFAKKAFSVIHAMHHSTADRIMWLDADVVTMQHIELAVLDKVMPDHVVSTHMAVTYHEDGGGRPGCWLVPETGVFVLNRTHPDFVRFRQEYTRRYVERDFRGLRRSYDNDVYGAVITDLSVPCLDLCAGFKKPYKTPLKHTILGPYLHHYKAKHSKDWFAQIEVQ